MRTKLVAEERERIRIEEENFIRLPVTKAERYTLLGTREVSFVVTADRLKNWQRKGQKITLSTN
jgi:hypothetical protein